jgi:aryl-alcohol dehydrogenase-like predicted oxidoreductase
MEHRQLGRSGLKVSAFCLGAMTFGESQTFMKGVTAPDDEARRMLDAALAAGVDFVDTADVYSDGRSEELLGQWLGERRRDVILATKCRFAVGTSKPRPMDLGLSRRHILEACENSLRRLKTDWIDLYQVHMQDRATPIDETLRALDDLVRSGKVRYIGCSNYTGYRLTESLWQSDRRNLVRYESVQLQWSLLERGAEREVIPACRAFELGVLVWSPLGRGLLSGKYSRDQAPPPGSRLEAWKDSYAKYNNERTWQIIEAVRSLARELESTPARVALAWLLAKPEVSSVIIGARNVKQLEDNLAAASVKLSPQHLEKLDKISEPTWAYPYDFIAMREPW